MQWYRNLLARINTWLDREIEYLDSLRYYSRQQPLGDSSMFCSTFSFNRLRFCNFAEITPAFKKELRSLISDFDENVCGIIIENSKLTDLNVFIAAMNQVQMKNKDARFFIVTDSQEVLLKLANVFNWMGRIFYVLPTPPLSPGDPDLQNSLFYHALKSIEEFISTPDCTLSKCLESRHQKKITFMDDPEEVFVFDCSSILPD